MHYHRREGVSRSCSEWKRGGSTLLWSSSVTGCRAVKDYLANLEEAPCWRSVRINQQVFTKVWSAGCAALQYYVLWSTTCTHYNHKGYRIKPHGQLVLVSYMHYCTSTPSLSTSWSRTTLQGGQAPGIPNLQTSFPLRCLQRLSLPYVATRQCHWHDNRYTSGTSTPVLSY